MITCSSLAFLSAGYVVRQAEAAVLRAGDNLNGIAARQGSYSGGRINDGLNSALGADSCQGNSKYLAPRFGYSNKTFVAKAPCNVAQNDARLGIGWILAISASCSWQDSADEISRHFSPPFRSSSPASSRQAAEGVTQPPRSNGTRYDRSGWPCGVPPGSSSARSSGARYDRSCCPPPPNTSGP